MWLQKTVSHFYDKFQFAKLQIRLTIPVPVPVSFAAYVPHTLLRLPAPLHTSICKFWNCCCLLTAFCILYIPIKCLRTMPEFQIRFSSEQVPSWMTDSQTNEHMPFRMHKRIKCRADWYTLHIPDIHMYVCKAVWWYELIKIMEIRKCSTVFNLVSILLTTFSASLQYLLKVI